jgi:hypothetical protein
LEETSHALHAFEERAAEAAIAEEVIVEEVQMPARQPIDFRQRIVDALRVERAPAGEERILVAEVAMLRTAAGDDDRVGDEIVAPGDEIAPDGRYAFERSSGGGHVASRRPSSAEVGEKSRERLLARAEEDRVGMRRRFVGQGGDVQSTERDEAAARSIQIGKPIRPIRIGDVDLDDDEIGRIVERERLDVFVFEDGAIVGVQIGGERGETERRKERVFDRPEERAGGFGEGGKDEFHRERTRHNFAL